MAPTHPTFSAHVTRSVARKNGGILRSLGAGVQKRFQCIICDKKHGSKAALSRHFKSHTTRPEVLSPFCHPSCWNEDSSHYPPSKRSFHDIMVEDDLFDALPSKRQRAIKNKFEYARAGVKNNRQLRQQKDLQHWSMLHWWFRTNEESLRARMEFGPEGLFPLQGEPKLEDEGQDFHNEGITTEDDSLLKLADATPISQVEPLSAAEAPKTQADQLVSNPDKAARSVSAQIRVLEHDFHRSLRGSFIADFELASSRPLTSVPLLWCLSNTFTHLVKSRGEDLVCVIALKRAAEDYLLAVGAYEDVVDKLNARFDRRILFKYDCDDHSDDEAEWTARILNAKRFREDRAFIWDRLEEATHEYFYENSKGGELPVALGARHSPEAVRVVVKATMDFVWRLGDTKTSAYMDRYWDGRI